MTSRVRKPQDLQDDATHVVAARRTEKWARQAHTSCKLSTSASIQHPSQQGVGAAGGRPGTHFSMRKLGFGFIVPRTSAWGVVSRSAGIILGSQAYTVKLLMFPKHDRKGIFPAAGRVHVVHPGWLLRAAVTWRKPCEQTPSLKDKSFRCSCMVRLISLSTFFQAHKSRAHSCSRFPSSHAWKPSSQELRFAPAGNFPKLPRHLEGRPKGRRGGGSRTQMWSGAPQDATKASGRQAALRHQYTWGLPLEGGSLTVSFVDVCLG